MTIPEVKKLNEVYPLFVSKYETFDLDEGAETLQKMNSIVETLNRLGRLSNETVNQWNKVMAWVLDEGINEITLAEIQKKMDEGGFDELISLSLDSFKQETETAVENISLELDEKASKKKVDWIDVVEDYGADPTGINDSTTAIQNALNEAKNLIINNGFKKFVQVRFPGGIYKTTSQIIVSQFVKTKAMGTVIFETYVANNSAFWFTPDAADPTFLTVMNKQQWFRSPFINGIDGGFIFINKLDQDTSNSTAIELGSRTDISGKPFARFSACDIAAENYNVGFKFNRFNNYISSFERIHLEVNNINVRFGDEGQNVVNSGENIHFSNSVFAVADTAFEWLSDGFDLRLVNCSTDFVQRVFYFKRGWRNISFFGGHIEAIGTRFPDATLQGGIAVFDVTNVNDAIVHLSINGTSALVRKDTPMFRCSLANKLRVSLENFHYRSVDLETNADKAWLADDTVIIDKKNMFYQGEGILPSRQVNENANPTFANDPDSTVADGLNTTPPIGYTVFRQNFVSDKIVSTQGYNGGKSVEFVGSSSAGLLKLTTSEFRPVKAGQTVIASCALKTADVTKASIQARINFYDIGDRLLSTGTLALNNVGFKNDIWNYPTRPRTEIAPKGAAKYKVEYVIENCFGTTGYMSGLYSSVCE